MGSSKSFLCVSGVDAKRFLQGQLTCHLDEITSTQSRLGAHCNPQGRVISFFRLFYATHTHSYYLYMPTLLVPITMQALKKYAVFFKVELHHQEENPDLPFDLVTTSQADEFAAGIPTIYPETSELFLPHEINLQHIQAMSFNKGCYTGQEIIARMQYRGKLKIALFQGTVHTPLLPVRGADIYDETQQPIGRIVDYYQKTSEEYILLLSAQPKRALFFDINKLYLIGDYAHDTTDG